MTAFPQDARIGPLGKLLAAVAGVLLLIAAVMFSLVILAVVAVAGTAVLGYFRWKTRKLRKAMQEHPPGGVVIDGEASVVDEGEPAWPVIVAEIQDKRF
jgi:O-antigen/teichoic acid export membrane protein